MCTSATEFRRFEAVFSILLLMEDVLDPVFSSGSELMGSSLFVLTNRTKNSQLSSNYYA